ncbi:N-acetyltransferase [bacterium]|nr:MAG: N-acetyltransferase [bacterium]
MYLHFETERLNIRPIQINDAIFLFELMNSEGWLRFIGDRKIRTVESAKTYIQNALAKSNFFYNVFSLKATNEPVGLVTLIQRDTLPHPDIGFAQLPQYEGNGYAFEAASAYLKRLRENRIENIIAITKPDNHHSIKLLTKLGLTFTNSQQNGHEENSIYQLK